MRACVVLRLLVPVEGTSCGRCMAEQRELRYWLVSM